MTKRLCVVPCGSAKIWDKAPSAGPQKAEDVYTGVFAVACQRYARAFFDHWVILSAKHGFLLPTDVVPESYNTSFVKPSSDVISLTELETQAYSKGLFGFEEITVLGGKHYTDRMAAIFKVGQRIHLPLHDCKGIGYMLQRITQAVEGKAPISISNPSKSAKKLTSPSVSNTTVGKYTSLYHHLRMLECASVTLTIEQIEQIVGYSLPASSSKHRAWWANDITHSQAKAWLLADWEVQNISLPQITFRRVQSD